MTCLAPRASLTLSSSSSSSSRVLLAEAADWSASAAASLWRYDIIMCGGQSALTCRAGRKGGQREGHTSISEVLWMGMRDS